MSSHGTHSRRGHIDEVGRKRRKLGAEGARGGRREAVKDERKTRAGTVHRLELVVAVFVVVVVVVGRYELFR